MEETLAVLVVDDEPGMRGGVARALSSFRLRLADFDAEVSFRVEQAASGEEALERIARAAPDLLLLDHKLPGLSGLEVLDRLSVTARPADETLAIMITAYAALDTAVAAIKRGAFDFLAKPFTPAELRETVRKAATNLMGLRQARRLAEEKRQVRFQFVSVLAHELKAPLNAVEGYLEILASRVRGEKLSDYDDMVGRCLLRTGHMKKLISDLLDMTRIESGQKARELVPLDLAALAREALETVRPAAEARGISLSLSAPSGLTFPADRGEIEMILNNLLTNAVKYNREGGRVEARIADRGGAVEIEVEDTGIGLTEEECARLFREFGRIKNAKTRNILGSGLGLSILQKLANLYGGSVRVRSRPDEGSTFTVELPRPAGTPHAVQ